MHGYDFHGQHYLLPCLSLSVYSVCAGLWSALLHLVRLSLLLAAWSTVTSAATAAHLLALLQIYQQNKLWAGQDDSRDQQQQELQDKNSQDSSWTPQQV